MAMGILAVFDMAGVDVGVNVHKANAERYPPDPSYYQADLALYEAGRFGPEERQGLLPLRAGDRAGIDDPEAHGAPRAAAKKLGIARAPTSPSRRSSSAVSTR